MASQLLVAVTTAEMLDQDLIHCGQYALQVATQIFAQILSTEISDEESIEVLVAVLDGFLGVNADLLLVESIVALSFTNLSNKVLMIESIEKLLHLLIRHTLRLSHHPTNLLSKFFHFLCGGGGQIQEEHTLSRVVEQITAHYCENLLPIFLLTERTEAMHLRVMLSFRLLEHFGKSYCSNAFVKSDHLQGQKSSGNVSTLSAERLDAFLGNFVDLLLSLLNGDPNSNHLRNDLVNPLYALIGDLCSLRTCQRDTFGSQQRRFTSALDGRLDSLAFSVFPATTRLGSGWLHFLGIYLEVNAHCYLSLAATNLLVGNVISSIQSHVALGLSSESRKSKLESNYSLQLQNTLQNLFCVVPAHLRERLIAWPLMNFILTQSVENETLDSQFIFGVIETLLRIGFCEWKDSKDSNSEFCQNYKRYVVERACWYSEQMTTVSIDQSVSSLFDHIIGASKLYQLQFRALYTSRTLKIAGQINSESDSTKRQSEGTLSTLLYNSIVSFLSLSSSRLLSLLSISYNPEVMSAILSLTRLLIDLLSSSHYPLLNSNSGTVALIVRQLLLISLMSLTTTSINQNEGLNVDSLRLMGRVLMVLAANKHIQRHAHLFVGGVIDVLGGYAAALQSSQQTQHRDNRQSSQSMDVSERSGLIVTISSNDETLREHLFPGIFALLDRSLPLLASPPLPLVSPNPAHLRCRTMKQRKQIFSILDERSRLMFNDLNAVYQQDYKFLGKA
jgi:hypothetical protein